MRARRISVHLAQTGMPVAIALLSATAPTPAAAHCDISDKVETCTGSVTGGAIVHDENGVHSLTVSDLANAIDAADSADADKQDGPVILLQDPGGVTAAPSDWSDSNRNGQAGIAGDSGSDLDATLSLDTGYGLQGQSGVTLGSSGWQGSPGHEAHHFDKHATGGQGGTGGDGGDLVLTGKSNGGGQAPKAITATGGGDSSTGLALFTIGGAGGDGGWAHSEGGLKDAQGGAGGNGGAAGTVRVELLDGHALTYSGAGIGIVVEASGGAGGNGGYGEVDGIDADSAHGGAGGKGGSGGSIALTAEAGANAIAASGPAGIALVSLGGDGGTGGAGKGGHDYAGAGGDAGDGGDIQAIVSARITMTGADSGFGIFLKSAGGFAGDSGSDSGGIKNHPGAPGDPGQAGSVTLSATGAEVTTDNAGADGILLQSVGGMGSSGGDSSGLFTYGSKGGSGGAGGAVSATLTATTVKTLGNHASAFHVHNIGGGGGKAGKASGLSALAAAAGAGGTGGAVEIVLTGTTLQTGGINSAALNLQSIGGGGGSSGAAEGVYAVGGQGGLGGAGGAVSLTVDGAAISTAGFHARGIALSSIGAGGGDSHSPSGVIALGQDGGGGGNGVDVTYLSRNDGAQVATQGHLSDAILLQSVGGGGGNAGSSFEAIGDFSSHVGATGGGGGSAGDISYTGTGADTVATAGHHARGIVLQSIGGGGGTGGNIVTISTGLSFGSSAGSSDVDSTHHGGSVTADIGGKIATQGDGSVAVLAHSVGGGGGAAGSQTSITVGISLGHDQGASGGKGGSGGTVTVTSSADISTDGAGADGIMAQSVGGGGGQSSNIVNADVGLEMSGFTSQQGASGGAGGDGGDVTAESTGSIATKGDNALGLVAQSIAGGGGRAGHTISAAVAVDLGSVTLGQSGGQGGNAGKVSVDAAGSVTTGGALATAVLAQSIGGGGGHAGLTVNGELSGLQFSSTQGGAGGGGGTGGAVSVTGSGSLSTAGDGAMAILAQSMGGAGGAGGTTVHGSVSVISLSNDMGGDGGDGGTAGTVTVSSAGKVATAGNRAGAIVAQSIGGSGGTAGTLVNGNGTGGEVSGALTLSVGGSGGGGGKAADVVVTGKEGGTITTAGYNANGVTAQSIGGDGGSGGNVISGDLAASSEGSLTVNVSVGGEGGKGGQAGGAQVRNDGGVATTGDYSDAIFAQSVGGNGGDGGSSHALTANATLGANIESTITVGGAGGSGAIASKVQVTNTGQLSTAGGSAAAIYAQSIGGNGGVGGSGLAFFGNFEATAEDYISIAADVHVGGAGGSGSDAGAVDVTNDGDIATAGDTSPGIWAQSAGGGGGDGGSAGSYSMGYLKNLSTEEGEELESKGFKLAVTVGGGGGGGGDGGAATVSSSQSITSEGVASYGIFAQSVGGGGGSGGNGSPGLEGWFADIYEDVEKFHQWQEVYEEFKKAKNKDWKGLFLEGFSVDVGGSAGGTGDGGAVTVTNSGTIATSGDSATAIYAQSVGGGGGTGGDGSQGMLTSVTVSGSGGAGGDGGKVSVDNHGTIRTSGAGAMGIYAQSVGGGGGSAGDVEGTIASEIGGLDEILGYNIFGSTGGSAGDGGDGGDVAITMAGSIETSGENAHGIWVQSAGGGGGAASSYGNEQGDNAVGSDGLEGNSGYVSIALPGSLRVGGTGAHGIFAQSVSGGSGTSYSGGVGISISGTLTASGANARAILAHAASYTANDSTSDTVAGTVQIDIHQGAVVSTTSKDAFETVLIKGGRSIDGDTGFLVSNRLTNSGTLSSAGPDAIVLATDDAAGLLVHNHGLMSGSVSAGNSNAVHFYNYGGGSFALGTQVDFGTNSGSFFHNSGVISAAGLGTVGSSTLTTGRLEQSASGAIQVDLSNGGTNAAPASDLITVDVNGKAGAVVLAGKIAPNWVGPTGFASGDTGSFTYLETADGAAIDSSALSAPASPAIAYTLRSAKGDTALVADYVVDYTGAASGLDLGSNAVGFARYFSSAMAALGGAPGKTAVSRALQALATEFLNHGSGEILAAAYGEHVLDEGLIGAANAIDTAHDLHGLLQSCPELEAGADRPFYRQRECVWAEVQGEVYRQDATETAPSFDEYASGLSAAAQKEVVDDTFIEFGGQLEQVRVSGSNFTDQGTRTSAGVALKKEIGAFTLSATLGGGHYGYDRRRGYSVAGIGYTAEADLSGVFATGEARVSAVLPWDGFYAKPALALSATRLWQDGYTETGQGPLNWQVDSVSSTSLAAHPSLELGHAFEHADHAAVAFVRVGVNATLSDTGTVMTTRLVGAPLGDLIVTSEEDRYALDLTGGLDMDLSHSLAVAVQGQTSLSEIARAYGGAVRLKLRF
ncbi:hypothetical protein ACFOGJ_00525 [Marinibaculum pumilum]|uniref:Autotransporter domain-containing protein n=1 Tax=Marinibaculum pumilum TaxID=1766165 RepID=A0ABV7KTH9_9PROT